MRRDFDEFLTRIQEDSDSQSEKGRRFEAIIRRAWCEHPIYGSIYSRVQSYRAWARARGESAQDTGIDLVAEYEDGGYAAIQCKFYDRDTPLNLNLVDRFISASSRPEFVERYFVWTGGALSEHVNRRLEQVEPHCQLISRDALAGWGLNWLELYLRPEDEEIRFTEKHTPREDQEKAIADVLKGFQQHDRGRLILPCGTGKTVTSLWLAERQVGIGGRVLYLVPSIALISQSMREWSKHCGLRLRYVAVCSDRTVGRLDEDRSLAELDIPAATTTEDIVDQLRKRFANKLTVVFSTYQSLERIAEAQDEGAPEFDLVICDEAHRTTGVESAAGKSSHFTLVHNEERIRAKKRLYTTATPRLYTAASKTRAAERERAIYSMDDEGVYGPQFHRMTFGEAITQDLLSDYRVSILRIDGRKMGRLLNSMRAGEDALSGEEVEDIARLIGCWDAMADPEGATSTRQFSGAIGENPCTTALAFATTIANSKNFAAGWAEHIPNYRELQVEMHGAIHEGLLEAEVQHVDGTHNALTRHERLSWLDEISKEHHYDGQGRLQARILSNARCLTEGVDVPALEAILFIAPRRSTVDIVQAVGRVMRKAKNKQYGYIILPVVINEFEDAASALESSAFQTVWDVLSALRSHDDRLDATVSLDIREKLKDRIFIWGKEEDEGEREALQEDIAQQLPLQLADIPPGLIYAKIIEKVGDRDYLPRWAGNVAEIYTRLRERIDVVIQREGVDAAGFQTFIEELRATINPTFGARQAIEMLAQHILTAPVFDALFAESNFAQRNPVARSFNAMVERLEANYGLRGETSTLAGFYERVRTSLQGLSPEQRQDAMMHLYENFFQKALRKEATRLGVVYTPAPLVDFLLRSADWALRRYFGKRLADEGVHILDPFAGTGTFLTRLI